jgi:hypothetical protein
MNYRRDRERTPDDDMGGTGTRCDACGCYRMVPHCNRDACGAIWCVRCMHEVGVCGLHDLPNYPETITRFNPNNGERIEIERKHYQPCLVIGEPQMVAPYGSAPWTKELRPMGFEFDSSRGLPMWPIDELLEMLKMLEAIRALPGPSTW